MAAPRWAEDLRRWYDGIWLTSDAPDRRARRRSDDAARREAPRWLLAIAPFAVVAAAVGVLLIAIATR
ncbi:MAG: hypothetical protein ABR946_11485 [Solirubrobacteraceae bacterium]|jgi:hypothetical protein